MSAADYRPLFEDNPNAIVIFRRDTRVLVAVNEAACKHYGDSREELLGRDVMMLRPPEDVEEVRRVYKRTDALPGYGEPMPSAGVWRHLRKDGTVVHAEIWPLRLEYEGHPSVLALIVNGSERIRSEAVLRDAEARWRAIVDHSDDHIVEIDADDVIRFLNSEHSARLVGTPFLDLVPPGHRQRTAECLTAARRTGTMQRLESERTEETGETRSYDTRFIPLQRGGTQRQHFVHHNGHHGAQEARSAASSVPEDGSDRAARRRSRPRLQQPPQRHPRVDRGRKDRGELGTTHGRAPRLDRASGSARRRADTQAARLLAQAGAPRQAARPWCCDRRLSHAAPTRRRRKYRARSPEAAGSARGRSRPPSARAGAPQSVHERASGHRVRRAHRHRGPPDAPRRGRCSSGFVAGGRRRVRGDPRHGHWRRYGRGDTSPRVRAVLHDERGGHRPRPRDGPRHRSSAPRARLRRESARAGDHRPSALAARERSCGRLVSPRTDSCQSTPRGSRDHPARRRRTPRYASS